MCRSWSSNSSVCPGVVERSATHRASTMIGGTPSLLLRADQVRHDALRESDAAGRGGAKLSRARNVRPEGDSRTLSPQKPSGAPTPQISAEIQPRLGAG